MLFSSLVFLFVFLPSLLFLYYGVFHKRECRNLILTFFSLLFYAWGEPYFVLIMIISVIMNYIWGLMIDCVSESPATNLRHIFLAVAIISNLSLLGYYKYADFIISNVNALVGVSIPLTNNMLPIGISFFTFQAMSYVFDVYKKTVKVQRNPLNLILYVSFFPQLVAGPIVRYETVADQIMNRRESFDLFSRGIQRFMTGLVKKVLLSNQLALIADKAFNTQDYSQLSVCFAFLGAFCYALQIYYDFSGYSDMAIGLSHMFGFSFPENFNYPYISVSVSEFWRRWHISLGTWFRDYVYFPMGGSRVKSRVKLLRNLFIVWLLTGLWHGASWNFVLWGLLHFVWIAFEKATGLPQKLDSPALREIYRIITLSVILIGWVLFRTDNVNSTISYLMSMFGRNGNEICDAFSLLLLQENLVFIVLAVIFATPLVQKLSVMLAQCMTEHQNVWVSIIGGLFGQVLLLLLLMTTVAYLVKGSYNPFIYFNF